MEQQEVVRALATLTAQIKALVEAQVTYSDGIMRRLDAINGGFSEHTKAISTNHERIAIQENRWIMLGWVAGALATGTTLTVALVALLQN